MMTDLPVRQQSRGWLPDFWSGLLTGFPSSLTALHPGNLIKLEDDMEDGRYTLRAEIPGIDPDKDVDITVRDGRLTIKAERTERKESKGRSEFSYSSFARSVTLPPGADEDDINATYDKGILTVSVGIPEQAAAGEKHIAVHTAG
ncbi:Hsp20/alpha crystallin family protein [Mycobacterium paragordonae]